MTPSEIAAQLPQCTPHCSSQDRIDHAHAHSTPPAHAQAEGGGAGGWVVEDGLEVAAVLVMHDPRDWYRDLQIISDLLVFGYSSALTSSAGKDCASDEGDEGDAAADIDSEGRAAPALYFSNPDFLFSGEHPSPRLAQGRCRCS